jgi:hypothetical protein
MRFRRSFRSSGTPLPPQPVGPITGEELQVKFLSDSEENAEESGPKRTRFRDDSDRYSGVNPNRIPGWSGWWRLWKAWPELLHDAADSG